MRADTAITGKRNDKNNLQADLSKDQEYCAISQPDVVNHRESSLQDAIEAAPHQSKKKRAGHKRMQIFKLNENCTRIPTPDELDSKQKMKQRYHKMMVVKKNQKFVAMLPLNDLKEQQKGFANSSAQLTNRSQSSHRLQVIMKEATEPSLLNQRKKVPRREIKSTSRLAGLPL